MAKKIVRKIQKIGNSSYALVLPKEWVRELKIDKSGSLFIEVEGPKLIISPSENVFETEKFKFNIEVSDSDKASLISRIFISAYLLGAKFITIKSKEGKLRQTLKEELKKLAKELMIGIEVTEESAESITFQELVYWPSVNLNALIRRMHNIALSMIRDSYTAILKDDLEIKLSVISSDSEVDRFYFYGVRVLNGILYNEDMLKSFGLKRYAHVLISKSLIKSIERIADHAVSIASSGVVLKNNGTEFIDQIYKQVTEVFEAIYEVLLYKDRIKANEIIEKVEKIRENISKANTNAPKDVLEHFERIAEYTSDIAENIIDYSVSEEMFSY